MPCLADTKPFFSMTLSFPTFTSEFTLNCADMMERHITQAQQIFDILLSASLDQTTRAEIEWQKHELIRQLDRASVLANNRSFKSPPVSLTAPRLPMTEPHIDAPPMKSVEEALGRHARKTVAMSLASSSRHHQTAADERSYAVTSQQPATIDSHSMDAAPETAFPLKENSALNNDLFSIICRLLVPLVISLLV